MLSHHGTFTSLSQIEEYIKQRELRCLHLDDDHDGIWSRACLPAARITKNPRVYEGHIGFRHVHIRLIFSNEVLLGCVLCLTGFAKKGVSLRSTTQMINCVSGNASSFLKGLDTIKHDLQK